MVQINDNYYEDLDGATFTRILDDLAAGKSIEYGNMTGRLLQRLKAARRSGTSTRRSTPARAAGLQRTGRVGLRAQPARLFIATSPD